MRLSSRLIRKAGVVIVASVLTAGLGMTANDATAAAPAGTPISYTAVHRKPTVGPLFFHGLAAPHGCTASVVHSQGHDLVLTAAHCISGSGAGILFAPGYLDGDTPNGVWTVLRVWVDPAWVRSQDPRRDYAFLQVAAQRVTGRSTNVEDVTGSASLGITAHHSSSVRVNGYPAGIRDAPITCRNRIVYTSGYPTFNCRGYFGGTSGSPFVATGHDGRKWVIGVIGGLHQGGCHNWSSYSALFDDDIIQNLSRAETGRDADTAPSAAGDGC